MRRTFKYRLYPGRAQRAAFERALETCRVLYNDALAERRRQAVMFMLPVERHWLRYGDQANSLPGLRKENPSLSLVYSQVLQDTLRRVDKSFKAFFRRVKAGGKPGYPRFRGWDRYDSFTYPQSGFRLDGKKLVLSRIGEVNIKLHRPIPDEAVVKTCTIRRDVDRWYACFTVELPDVPRREPESAVGVDLGLYSLVALSDGETVDAPKHLAKAERKLRKGQRWLSRKKLGSRNRVGQRRRVARVHRKIREQRGDFLHKLSRDLVDKYDFIALEDLRIRNMLRNHHLAKSIADAAWNQLQGYTAYKAEEAGKTVVLVDPNGTSQECSQCGAIVEKSLAVRVHRCPECGLVIDRDVNAARNILKRAVGEGLADLMPAGGFPLGAPMNQEVTLLVGW